MNIALVGVLIFVAAVLYSSVGQAGASGYLAVMALCGVTAAVMKPTALTLNVLVASIATARFARAGCFSWSLLWPFAIASVPMSFIGGAVSLPANIYNPIVGAIMLFAACLLHRTRCYVGRNARQVDAAAFRSGVRGRDWAALWADGVGRRHLPDPAVAVQELGRCEGAGGGLGCLHLGELPRRSCR